MCRRADVVKEANAMMIQTSPATIEANRELGRRFFQEQDRLRGGPAAGLCAPEYVALLGGNPAMNRDGHEGFARAFYSAFEDLRHEVQEVFATEDRVAVRFVLHGTHTGSFFGVPPTQRTVAVAAHVILHVSGGTVTKLLGIFDEAGLLRQLGILNA
jgi:predicted ester cyclase